MQILAYFSNFLTIFGIKAAILFQGTSRYDTNVVLFQPRLDADFFPKDYPDLIKESPKKPTMLGLTAEEGGFFSKKIAYFMQIFEFFMQTLEGFSVLSNFLKFYVNFSVFYANFEVFMHIILDG